MYAIVWEFRPQPGRAGDFETVYGGGGAWVKLFSQAPGYLGTDLLRDSADDARYITVDRWESLEAYEDFRARFDAEYRELDGLCEGLTSDEVLVGRFDAV